MVTGLHPGMVLSNSIIAKYSQEYKAFMKAFARPPPVVKPAPKVQMVPSKVEDKEDIEVVDLSKEQKSSNPSSPKNEKDKNEKDKNEKSNLTQLVVDEAMDLMLKLNEHFDVKEVRGDKIYLKYTAEKVMCPICDKVHDKGEPRLHLTAENLIYFNCGQKPLNKKEMFIGKCTKAEEIKKKEETSSNCCVM